MNRPTTFGKAVRVPLAAVGFALLSSTACHIPNLRPPESGPILPASYSGAFTSPGAPEPPALSSPTTPPAPEFYTDPNLVALLQEALIGNQEFRILNEEVQVAANEVRARRGAIFPTIGLEAGGGFDRNSAFTPLGAAERQLTYPTDREFPDPVPGMRLGAIFNWQVDLWRELRNARDAAAARLAAAVDRRNAFANRLVADIADNYYQLLALDARLVVLEQTIALQEESLKTAVAFKNAGRGTELAVQRFEAEVFKNQSEMLVVWQEQVEAENRINFLLGRYPRSVDRTSESLLELTLDPPDAGLPAQLLLSRPDIRQAERELEAAGLDVLVARARFLPRLDITAGLGWEAFNPRYLFDPGSFIASAAAGFAAPLVNREAIKADYLAANARQLQAVYNYQRVALEAFTEVVTQLTAAENFRRSVEAKKRQIEALEASVDSATKLFQAARGEYTEVLFTQRETLDARVELIEIKRRQIASVVAAYAALGGGFPLADPPIYE